MHGGKREKQNIDGTSSNQNASEIGAKMKIYLSAIVACNFAKSLLTTAWCVKA